MDDPGMVDEQEVKIRLLRVFRAPEYSPPVLPAVALEILQLSQRPNVSFREVANVLEKDGLLTAQVLKIAQSPLFAGRQDVTSIQQAMVRLGLRTVRDLVIQVALNAKVFRCSAYQGSMDRLRRHATAVAHLARIISKYTTFDSEYAFLCGLLHDVGIAAALIALAEDGHPHPPSIDEVASAVVAVHEEAAGLVAAQWGLPPDVQLVLKVHHRRTASGQMHPVAALISMADDLANKLGFGFGVTGEGPTVEPSMEPVLCRKVTSALGLGEAQLKLINKDAENVTEQLVSL